ncbi:MAG: type II toxin-antitoxin system VapC family toxin [Sphingomonas adhaesiva]|uniref:type II toxin-antitoxin system VapC family toxin n=1 Tax=Sphingomonas adhaesiva TaxID=28212 RepID=UPI002FF796C1
MDTNVVVRLIVGDDPDQVALALKLAERDAFYVSFTVLEEVEWVLRSRFGYGRDQIVHALRALADLVILRYEDDDDARWAIERYALSGELADYLHIASARVAGRFATFERRLARRAGSNSPVPVETLA